MSWRPEGWRNPYNGNAIILREGEIDIARALTMTNGKLHTRQEILEAGADAMLEALRALGHHVNCSASFSSLGEHCTLSNENNTGTYLFIPDDVWGEEVKP